MARVQHVKKAQQRYETVPVIDEATGQPQRVPVLSSRTGEQKHSKRGPVWRTVTREDRTRPKPLYVCGSCQQPIEVGTPYKYVDVKTGPYSSRTLARHEGCPSWQPWELSNSLGARLAQVADTASKVDTTDPADVAQGLRDAAESVRELVDEKREAASNIEEGFGHETEQSSELASLSDDLEGWADELEAKADEVESLEVPDEFVDCDTCGGTNRVSGDADDDDGVDECADCEDGEVENPEHDDFLGTLQEAIDMAGEPPV